MGNLREELRSTSRFLVCIIRRLELLFQIAGGLDQEFSFGELPGGPVVRTRRFHCRGAGSIPGLGTKIPQAVQRVQKISSVLDILRFCPVDIQVHILNRKLALPAWTHLSSTIC